MHIVSTDQLARDLSRVLACARAGEEIHIEDGSEQPLVIQAAGPPIRRTASEILAPLQKRSEELTRETKCKEEGTANPVTSQPVEQFERRTASETLARLRAYEKRIGKTPRMDDHFVRDMEEIIAQRKPLDTSAWDLVRRL